MAYGLLGTITATPGRRDDVVVTEVWSSQEAHDAPLTRPAVREPITEARPLIAGMQPGVLLDVPADFRTIVLIDGPMLARLMVDHGVGVQVASTHTLKRLDQDYFDEL